MGVTMKGGNCNDANANDATESNANADATRRNEGAGKAVVKISQDHREAGKKEKKKEKE